MKPRVFTERAFVIRRVEAIQQPHVGDCIERGTARQNESVASCFTYQIIDNVKKSIFEHHLGGRSFVEPLLGVRRVILFLDAENGIGIPCLLLRDRRAQYTDEFPRVRFLDEAAVPVGQRPVEIDLPVGFQ